MRLCLEGMIRIWHVVSQDFFDDFNLQRNRSDQETSQNYRVNTHLHQEGDRTGRRTAMQNAILVPGEAKRGRNFRLALLAATVGGLVVAATSQGVLTLAEL
jgi:hypothetical protein